MADKEINIVVRLKDEFTSAAEKVQASTQKIGQSMDAAGKHVQQFGTKLAFVGGATTGAFLLAMNNVQGAVPAVQRSFSEMDNVLRNFQVSIAQSVAPAFQKLVDLLATLVDAWNSVDPALRAAALQFVFLGGAALIAAGGILKVGGAVISITGKLTTLISAALSPMALALLAVSAAVVYMIKNWESVRQYVLPVINTLNIAIDFLAIGYLKLQSAILGAWEATLRFVKLDTLANGAKAMKESVDALIVTLEQDMTRALETGKGSMATFVDEGVGKIRGFVTEAQKAADAFSKAWERGTQKSKEVVVNWAGLMKDTVQRVANAMAQSLGNFFYNVLTGQIKSAKQAFVEFGQSVLRILADVMARILLQKLLASSLSSAFGIPVSFFHSGGQIRKAHSGMSLRQDEVPIIGQEGEGILTRQGMNSLGANNLQALNRGESMGQGGGSPPVIVIQAWDTRDIVRNQKSLEAVIGNAIRRNSGLRGVIKQYG